MKDFPMQKDVHPQVKGFGVFPNSGLDDSRRERQVRWLTFSKTLYPQPLKVIFATNTGEISCRETSGRELCPENKDGWRLTSTIESAPKQEIAEDARLTTPSPSRALRTDESQESYLLHFLLLLFSF